MKRQIYFLVLFYSALLLLNLNGFTQTVDSTKKIVPPQTNADSSPNENTPTIPISDTTRNEFKDSAVSQGDSVAKESAAVSTGDSTQKEPGVTKSDSTAKELAVIKKNDSAKREMKKVTGKAAKTGIYVVNANALNIRAERRKNAKITGKLKKGDQVSVLDVKNNWAHIKFNNLTGYVAFKYLKINDRPDQEKVEQAAGSLQNFIYKHLPLRAWLSWIFIILAVVGIYLIYKYYYYLDKIFEELLQVIYDQPTMRWSIYIAIFLGVTFAIAVFVDAKVTEHYLKCLITFSFSSMVFDFGWLNIYLYSLTVIGLAAFALLVYESKLRTEKYYIALRILIFSVVIALIILASFIVTVAFGQFPLFLKGLIINLFQGMTNLQQKGWFLWLLFFAIFAIIAVIPTMIGMRICHYIAYIRFLPNFIIRFLSIVIVPFTTLVGLAMLRELPPYNAHDILHVLGLIILLIASVYLGWKEVVFDRCPYCRTFTLEVIEREQTGVDVAIRGNILDRGYHTETTKTGYTIQQCTTCNELITKSWKE